MQITSKNIGKHQETLVWKPHLGKWPSKPPIRSWGDPYPGCQKKTGQARSPRSSFFFLPPGPLTHFCNFSKKNRYITTPRGWAKGTHKGGGAKKTNRNMALLTEVSATGNWPHHHGVLRFPGTAYVWLKQNLYTFGNNISHNRAKSAYAVCLKTSVETSTINIYS